MDRSKSIVQKRDQEKGQFADRIKRIRGRMGLTQEALAEELGVSFATVNRWENRQTRPSRIVLEKIASLDAKAY